MPVTINAANSVFQTANTNAFTSLAGDTITVEGDGYLVASATAQTGMVMVGSTPYDLTIRGTVISNAVGFDAISLSTTGKSTIELGTSGIVRSSATTGDGHAMALYSATDVTNFGTISTMASNTSAILFAFNGSNLLHNRGQIFSGINNAAEGVEYTGTGTHRIINDPLGSISRISSTNSAGVEIINNSGFIFSASLGGGDDFFYNYSYVDEGEIIGSGTLFNINMGAGNDQFYGGNNGENVADGAGSDVVRLAGGDDDYAAPNYQPGDGIDRIFGGAGYDSYYAAGDAAVVINLGTIARSGAAASRASGTLTGVDNIYQFESAIGGFRADLIHGSGVQNLLSGLGGNDRLFGHDGNDTLEGGAGADRLTGGLGKDFLEGNTSSIADGQRDTFDFNTIAESLAGAANRDVITDFFHGEDKIDLFHIDANGAAAGNGAFALLAAANAAFTGVSGQLRYRYENQAGTVNDKTIVEGDINGDRVADFAVEISKIVTLTAIDFVL